jgi:hypothetical protein
MNIDVAFPSKFLKASDLQAKRLPITIAKVAMETVGSDRRAVVYFKGMEKLLVLNKTNANMIKEITGTAETGEWAGMEIVLYPARVDFQGRRVDSIRVDRVSERDRGRQGGGAEDVLA